MVQRPKKPTSLKDFKSRPLSVSVTKTPKDEGDRAATQLIMEQGVEKDGWHCPKCGEVFPIGDVAVAHLAKEINEALASLGK